MKSANKNTELHNSCLEMGTLLQTTMILLKCPVNQHIFIMTPGDFSIIIIERNTTPLVKGRGRHFSHVRLCCGCRAACGPQIQQQGRLRSWVAHVTADAASRLP